MALTQSHSDADTPFSPLAHLLHDFNSYLTRPGGHHHNLGSMPWQPRFDLQETSKKYELHGELPGLRKSDVKVEFTDPRSLIIKGRVEKSYETPPADSELTKTAESKDTDPTKPTAGSAANGSQGDQPKVWLSERSVGEFSRGFTFSLPVKHEFTTATFKDGILTVVVPKGEDYSSYSVPVN